jgi:hypothetical protein
MPPKFLTASIVALFCCTLSFVAWGVPPTAMGDPSMSVAPADAGAGAEEATPDAGATTGQDSSKELATGQPDQASWPDDVEALVQAFRSGDWRLVAAFALIALMVGLRRIREKLPWFQGDRGGAIMVMLLSLAGALSTSLATDAPVDVRMFLSAVAIAWTAVGGYTWLRRLIWPADKPPAAEVPAELPKAQVVVR